MKVGDIIEIDGIMKRVTKVYFISNQEAMETEELDEDNNSDEPIKRRRRLQK